MPSPQMTPAWLRRQAAARRYQPKRIRVLILAESPPEGDRYFYFEQAEALDPLFEQVSAVLFEAPPEGDRTPYLKELRRRGVFAAELKPDSPRQGEPLGEYVGPLLINLGTLSPEKIILVGPDAYDAAYRKLEQAGLPVVDVRVPAPAAGHETDFRQKLRQALVRAGLEKLIRQLPASKPRRDAAES